MASKLYISEYAYMPQQTGVLFQVGSEPAITTQLVDYSGGATQSSAFNANTRFVRLHTDSICSIAFGTNPTATTSTARMAASQTEFFGVVGGQKVSAIINT